MVKEKGELNRKFRERKTKKKRKKRQKTSYAIKNTLRYEGHAIVIGKKIKNERKTASCYLQIK